MYTGKLKLEIEADITIYESSANDGTYAGCIRWADYEYFVHASEGLTSEEAVRTELVKQFRKMLVYRSTRA